MKNAIALSSLIENLQMLQKSNPAVEVLAIQNDKASNIGFGLKKVYINEQGDIEILNEQMLEVHKESLKYYTDHTDMQIWGAMSQDERLCYHESFKELQASNAQMRENLRMEIAKFDNAKTMLVMKFKN